MSKEREGISLYVTPELKKRIAARAEKDRRSMSAEATLLLEAGLEAVERRAKKEPATTH